MLPVICEQFDLLTTTVDCAGFPLNGGLNADDLNHQ
ncbi:hypothetical protein ROA7450_02365 [Roseovarius albus]|uniref:Uncharacterized protein n=1 Tax=Roseovarius albus TaxID=1247867 RepID=A0A1X6ZCJ4_9RHOB|nr:hypothetical protein ROA7450_02365 [Roseovarius albus]